MVTSNHRLVSVVIPCLNRAHFLPPTIDSVLDQDYPNIECIVVDGASTDGSVDILKGYGDRIKWVSEPDEGHADAINKGWRMSQGDILAWLNADDVWAVPDAVGQALAYFRADPEADLVYGDCGAIDADGNLVGMSYLHEWELAYAVEHCDHCIPQPAAFLRRQILEKVGWLDTSFNYTKKDHELWLRIGLVGKIRHVPVLLAYARACPGYGAQRGDLAAEACVRLTRKFFALPGVPESIRKKRRRAISNAYLRGLNYAFSHGRHWRVIVTCALRAVLADPCNARRAWRRFKSYARAGAEENRKSTLWRLLWTGYLGFRLPGRIAQQVKAVFRPVAAATPRTPNLVGDRDIEWSWITSQMPSGPGVALDFGPGGSHLALVAAQRGFEVTAVDLEPVRWPYAHPSLRFIRGDILKLPLSTEHFDLVINCSTVEHVGLAGRYGVTENRPNGDLEAMARLKQLMKPRGIMLLIMPVGKDALFAPLTRVYGKRRLPRLLEGYAVEKESFWVKDQENRWVLCDRETALNFEASAGSWDALQNVYALGCFVLRKPDD